MNDLLRCAAAGFAATLPMTAWMLAAQRLLPAHERYPLPPEEITANAAGAAGADAVAAEPAARRALSLVNHFAYGAAAGALYAPLLGLGAPPLAKGAGLGVAVWAGSYLGLLPALGLLGPATRHPARRTALMVAAHLVWGGGTALLAERTRQR
jgi:putative membrane protein